jgi:acyl phosphate:glycerol-3-phosphate acyltransferase
MFSLIISFVLGYFSGSIPFGLLLTSWAGMGDVRQIGSGNIGATNVLRMGNKKIAALTLLGDGLKGTIAVLAAQHFWGDMGAILAAFGAMAGHIFPIWLKFKGGKGVATFIGILFGLYWPLGLMFLGIWLLVALMFRYSSLAALIATLVQPLLARIWGVDHLVWPLTAMVAVIWLMHRANIMRLLTHSETKINFAKKS